MNDLGSTLALLSAESLVRRVLTESGSVYKFRHTLDQQTAYHSLLRQDRERIHKVVGQVIERDPPEDLGALAPMLAEHFSVGGDEARAVKYFSLAGDEAARVYANAEALSYYQRAMIAAGRSGSDPEILRDLYL
jgi:predicted ATPase